QALPCTTTEQAKEGTSDQKPSSKRSSDDSTGSWVVVDNEAEKTKESPDLTVVAEAEEASEVAEQMVLEAVD
ncbi:unnamed protein product, partial [Heterosigma akashiwo]